MSSKIIRAESSDIVAAVFGSCDSNLDIIEKKFGVALHNRVTDDGGEAIVVSAENEEAVINAAEAVRYLVKMAKYNGNITDQSVIYVCDTVIDGRSGDLESLGDRKSVV